MVRTCRARVSELLLLGLDRANIIAIDVSACWIRPHRNSLLKYPLPQTDHNVTPDSLLILRAAQEVVEKSGFNKLLDDVRNRVDEIESLHRTRELTVGHFRGHMCPI